jgi:hypothetical protein
MISIGQDTRGLNTLPSFVFDPAKIFGEMKLEMNGKL